MSNQVCVRRAHSTGLAVKTESTMLCLPTANRTVNLVGFIFLHGHSSTGINYLLCFFSIDYQLE